MTTSDPRIDALARKLADLERSVRSMSGPQLAYSSIEDGAVREYDDQGNLVSQTGRQYDGTHTSSSLGGPPPPRPSAPAAQDAVGGVLIGWDGLYAGGEVSPMDWARIDVAVGLPGFDPIATPPVGAITSPRGGRLFVKTGPGDYEVALIARSQSGKASPPSDTATVTALEEADPAVIAEARAEAAQALSDAAAAASAAAAAGGTADAALTAANGKNAIIHSELAPTNEPNTVGDTWFQHAPASEGGAIVAQFTGLGNGTWAATAISHQVIASIDLGVATVGKLSANYIDTGVLSAALQLTGMLIAGQPTGARVIIDDGGIRQYGSSGDLLINLPTDPDIPSKFEGEIITSSFTSIDRFTMQGLANEISRGATLVVSGGTSSPTTAPSVAYGYATYDPARWSYLFIPVGVHGDADDTPDVATALTFFGYGAMVAPGNRRYEFPYRTDDKGGQRSNYGNFGSSTSIIVGGSPRLVTFGLRTANNGSAPVGSMDSWDWSTMSTDGSTAPAIKAHEDMTADTYVYETRLGRVFGTGSTNLSNRMCIAVRRVLSNDVVLRVYSVSDTGFTRVGSDLVIGDPFDSTQDEAIIGVTYGGSARMGFPGTDQNIWLLHGSKNTYAYTAAGARLPEYDFPTPAGAGRMTAFGALSGNNFLGFRTTTWNDKSVITKLTNTHWFSGTPSKWWVSSTWYDNDIAGTGTHETAQSPRASITMPKRASLVVTIPPYPPRPFPTTEDDPLAARIYVARGNTDPGRANMERAAELTTPNRSTRIGNFAFPSGAAASPPPPSSNFPASSPGKITSADGTTWLLQGNGQATIGKLAVAANGATSLDDVDSVMLGNVGSSSRRVSEHRAKASGNANTYRSRQYLTDNGTYRGHGIVLLENDAEVNRFELRPDRAWFRTGIFSDVMRASEFRFTDASTGSATTTDGGSTGARGGFGTFDAPPSGAVLVVCGGQVKSSADGQYGALGFVLRAGSTQDSGTVVRAYDIDDAFVNLNVQYIRGSVATLVTGLAAGATYNIRQWAASGSGTANYSQGRLTIIPQT